MALQDRIIARFLSPRTAGLEGTVTKILQKAGFTSHDFYWENGLRVVNPAAGRKIVEVLNRSSEIHGKVTLSGDLVEIGKSASAKLARAGMYGPAMVKLVEQVEAWEALAKDGGPVTKALHALDELEALWESDDDWQSSTSGLNQQAPQQHIEDLREKLHAGQRVAKHIESTYDEMNAAFLRMQLK